MYKTGLGKTVLLSQQSTVIKRALQPPWGYEGAGREASSYAKQAKQCPT